MSRKIFDNIEKLAKSIINSKRKIFLYYAFNGIGKTRLSMELRRLVEKDNNTDEYPKILYYNSFIEDLFIWDNSDIDSSVLKIDMGSEFFRLLKDLGQEVNIIRKFQEFTLSKLEPAFNMETGEVTFRIPKGNEVIENIKISRGEESIFIWSIFLVMLEAILSDLSIRDVEERVIENYNNLKYIFIDDPMSSLDDNNIIEVAISLKELVEKAKSLNIKLIITTHHALFYNVIYNELGGSYKKENDGQKKNFVNECCFLKNNESEYIKEDVGDTNFGYHHFIKYEIKKAISENKIERYHFTLFRNLLEKTSTYLGYRYWGDLITEEDLKEGEREAYIRRINLYSHNKVSDLENAELKEHEKKMLKRLFENFIKDYRWKE